MLRDAQKTNCRTMEVFDVPAFHYLLKPIEEQKFMEVLCRAAGEAGKRKGQRENQIFIYP